MSVQVTMPQLGESVTEGTVTRWLKKVGDSVTADEALLEVSTDKVDTEIPSPVSGILVEIKVNEDEVVAVGAVIAVISSDVSSEPVVTPSAPSAPENVVSTPAPVELPTASVPSAQSGAASDTNVVLPALGESVTEGTVTRWLKKVGESVSQDEALVEISTDKVDTEIPAPVSGVVTKILVGEDSVAQVGSTLAIISSSVSLQAPVPTTPAPVVTAPVLQAPVSAPPQVSPIASSSPIAKSSDVDISDAYVRPLVRKLGAENNIDLSTLVGTGIGGRIRKQDVLDAVSKRDGGATSTPQKVQPQTVIDTVRRGRTEKLTRLRKVIADRMLESLQVSAQLTSVAEVDVTAIVASRDKNKKTFEEREGVKLSYMPFFAKAIVDTLKSHPVLNSSIDVEAGTVTYHDTEHLAIAVDTEKGLLVPVIRNAGDLSMAGLARHIADLAERTRSGQVSPDELSGGTFTLTNTGSRGALFDTPIINQPQVAILGLGAIVKRPVVVTDAEGRDSIAVRHMVYLSLTYDHRIVDGADAARFLVALKSRLESGNFDI
ncbi:MAG: 2-oxoglutarate dehydrogenase, E2 component, dihydrolipoamide succinyltransferase [Candidatus Nanopelagicales bacterium]